ncbi:unnamed protein product [Merluccius merluccius]
MNGPEHGGLHNQISFEEDYICQASAAQNAMNLPCPTHNADIADYRRSIDNACPLLHNNLRCEQGASLCSSAEDDPYGLNCLQQQEKAILHMFRRAFMTYGKKSLGVMA